MEDLELGVASKEFREGKMFKGEKPFTNDSIQGYRFKQHILQPLTVDSKGDFFLEIIGKLSKATGLLIL